MYFFTKEVHGLDYYVPRAGRSGSVLLHSTRLHPAVMQAFCFLRPSKEKLGRAAGTGVHVPCVFKLDKAQEQDR